MKLENGKYTQAIDSYTGEPLVVIQTWVPPSVREQLQALARTKRTTVKALTRIALERLVK